MLLLAQFVKEVTGYAFSSRKHKENFLVDETKQ
jgi:hypothetical protein